MLALHQKEGNNEWLGILLERYTLLLLGVCMKYLKNETEAKDAVQQIFLKVLTEVKKYKIDFFKSWIYMVAKNHCLMKLRNSGKQMQEVNDLYSFASDEKKEEILENERTYLLLEEAMEELNPEQKQCINLFYLQKKSYHQISAQTGFDTMKVKSYIQNGKRNLRMWLEKKRKQQS